MGVSIDTAAASAVAMSRVNPIRLHTDEEDDGGDGGDGASTDNPMFDNPALRGSMKDLHVNDADTDTTNKRGVGSINLAGTREELQEQTI